MPGLNLTVVYQIINFLLLLFLLNLIVYRPIRGILSKRKEEMTSTENSTREWIKKADDYSDEIEENILSTRKEGLKERIGLRNKGLEAEKELIEDAYSQVEEAARKAKEEIKDKIAQASVSLQGEMEAFSHELAEKILGRSL